MNIAVNTRLLIKDKIEGIGLFAFESLKRITHQHPEHNFFFIFDRPFDNSFIFSNNIKPIVVGPQARHPLLYYLWFEYSIPRILSSINPDLFLSPDGYLSLYCKTKSISVIHDLNFEHYPHFLPFAERCFYRHFFPKYAIKADRIITVSEFSKNDIVNKYSINPDKIDVVFNGVREYFRPLSFDEQIETRSIYSRQNPYFLFVGALSPRKNITNILRAFDIYKNTHSNFKLLIAGNPKWMNSEMKEVFWSMQYKEDVIFTGRVTNDELNRLMGSAFALLYPSIFEGFGIPILEAFACHTVVITSSISSMPEVAGDAALYVDPHSQQSIANAMLKITNNDALRKELIKKGIKRLEIFNWQKTSTLLWNSIEKVLYK